MRGLDGEHFWGRGGVNRLDGEGVDEDMSSYGVWMASIFGAGVP